MLVPALAGLKAGGGREYTMADSLESHSLPPWLWVLIWSLELEVLVPRATLPPVSHRPAHGWDLDTPVPVSVCLGGQKAQQETQLYQFPVVGHFGKSLKILAEESDNLNKKATVKNIYEQGWPL